MQKAQT